MSLPTAPLLDVVYSGLLVPALVLSTSTPVSTMSPLSDAPRPEWWETLFFEGLPPLYPGFLLSGLLVASLVALWAFVLRNVGAEEAQRVPFAWSEDDSSGNQNATRDTGKSAARGGSSSPGKWSRGVTAGGGIVVVEPPPPTKTHGAGEETSAPPQQQHLQQQLFQSGLRQTFLGRTLNALVLLYVFALPLAMWAAVLSNYQPGLMRFYLNDLLSLNICGLRDQDFGVLPWCSAAKRVPTSTGKIFDVLTLTMVILWVASLGASLGYFHTKNWLRKLFLKPVALWKAEIVLVERGTMLGGQERDTRRDYKVVEFCDVAVVNMDGSVTGNSEQIKVIDFRYTRFVLTSDGFFGAERNPMINCAASDMHALLTSSGGVDHQQFPARSFSSARRSGVTTPAPVPSSRSLALARSGANFVNFVVPSLPTFLKREFLTTLFIWQYYGMVWVAFYYYWQNASVNLGLSVVAGVQTALMSRRNLREVKELANSSAELEVEVMER